VNRRAPLFAAIGMVLLVIVVVFVAILPKMKQVTQREAELAAAEQEEQFLLAELQRLQDVRAQLPEVRRRLAKFNQKVPGTADLPGLIRLLQNAADASNLTFFSIAPGDPTPVGAAAPVLPTAPPSPDATAPPPPVVPVAPVGTASVIPSEVVIVGFFFDVDQFLFRLENLPRAAKVISISIVPGPNSQDVLGELQATLLVQVFTTDPNAGPGSAAELPPDEPGASPSPGATASPAVSPSPTTTGG
jgi:Tfp pilus assembly protein PilO